MFRGCKITKKKWHSLSINQENAVTLQPIYDNKTMTTHIKNLLEGAGKKKHLQRKTLDRFALLAGFQSWSDLHAALQGENDAQLNYAD